MIIYHKDKLQQVEILGRYCVESDILRPVGNQSYGGVFLRDIETNEEFSLPDTSFEIAQRDALRLNNAYDIESIISLTKDIIFKIKLYLKHKRV